MVSPSIDTPDRTSFQLLPLSSERNKLLFAYIIIIDVSAGQTAMLRISEEGTLPLDFQLSPPS